MPLSSASCSGGMVSLAWSVAVPPENVWSAWADPTMLSHWLGSAVECDIRAGGRLVVDHGEGALSRSDILDAAAPRLLVMTWEFPNEAPSRVSITLDREGYGTRLALVHQQLGDLAGPYESGWMTHLTFLEAAVEGDPLPTSQFWKLHDTFKALTAVDRGQLE
ncbi:SRPBCC domain-containing protein [Agreia sp. PsM10]|uniref:SRPBCC domain-containing protein n=1 Tax=Agreia sp. PsM10 TaxID=3030533 RepID=UPI00263AF942|nr:SRPBCC domain-containing protein [Agreia sp. PsM10]MDN4640793.1 SRPBCC domain-containing protein [Agreia sp. PsM10]